MRRFDDLNPEPHVDDFRSRPSFFWRMMSFLFKTLLFLLLLMTILLLLALFYMLASEVFGFKNVLFS